jgi:hypothetical protein
MQPPQIASIGLVDYHGGIGDSIHAIVLKQFEVKTVTVRLLTPANAVVEQGAAVLVNGRWTYTATTQVAPARNSSCT